MVRTNRIIMNYQVITQPELLTEFIDIVLPNLEPHEKFYVCLFARAKYCKDITHISSDKAQLKRFVATKETLYNKISQLEVPLGTYLQKGIAIPQEALALYISINPRNMKKASVNLLVKLAQSIANNDPEPNCHQEAMSQIQKSKSRTIYVDFDIDSKHYTPEEIACSIEANIGKTAKYEVLITRGGYHILIEPSTVEEQFKKTWHQNISKFEDIDQVGDQMIPVPGTYQGGFTPHFYKN